MTATLQLDLFETTVARSSDTVDSLVVCDGLNWCGRSKTCWHAEPGKLKTGRFRCPIHGSSQEYISVAAFGTMFDADNDMLTVSGGPGEDHDK